LLRIFANEQAGGRKPERVEVVTWIIDGARWSPAQAAWRSEHTIVLHGTAGAPPQVESVLIDGVKQRLRPHGQTYRLLVGLCLLAAHTKSAGPIDTAQLARDAWVFPDGPVTPAELRKQLISLKHHYLKTILSIGREIRLDATVEVFPLAPTAGTNLSPGKRPRSRSRRPPPDRATNTGDGSVVIKP
jgi:hypothetical protein